MYSRSNERMVGRNGNQIQARSVIWEIVMNQRQRRRKD